MKFPFANWGVCHSLPGARVVHYSRCTPPEKIFRCNGPLVDRRLLRAIDRPTQAQSKRDKMTKPLAPLQTKWLIRYTSDCFQIIHCATPYLSPIGHVFVLCVAFLSCYRNPRQCLQSKRVYERHAIQCVHNK
jgi:hypothetical protein